MDDTPIYAYIICDITTKLEKFMLQHQFQAAADNEMHYSFNSSMKVYIEVMSFDKMLKDSKRRNAIFFDKLKLQMEAPSTIQEHDLA